MRGAEVKAVGRSVVECIDTGTVWLADGPGSTQGDAGNAGLTVKTLDME